MAHALYLTAARAFAFACVFTVLLLLWDLAVGSFPVSGDRLIKYLTIGLVAGAAYSVYGRRLAREDRSRSSVAGGPTRPKAPPSAV